VDAASAARGRCGHPRLGELGDPVGDVVLAQRGQVGAEGVGLDGVRARLEVGGVDGLDHVGAGHVEDLVAALEPGEVVEVRSNPCSIVPMPPSATTTVGELLDFAVEAGAESVVCLGALLAEVPHTRPLPVIVTSEDAALRERVRAERSSYEGPTGIVGVLADAAQARDLTSMSLWTSVPHYAAGAHSAKATLAILRQLEDLFGWTLPHGDLAEDSRAWERGVDELASAEEEVAEYVRHLEASTDAADSPAASGDAIAREFERYLRGRGEPDASR
jgi:hypothetical protein